MWTSSCSLQIMPESVRRASSAPPPWSSLSMLWLRPRTLRRRSASEASWTWAPSPSPTTRLWTSLWISSGSWGCASVWLHTTGENKHVTTFLSVLICRVYYCRGRKAPDRAFVVFRCDVTRRTTKDKWRRADRWEERRKHKLTALPRPRWDIRLWRNGGEWRMDV